MSLVLIALVSLLASALTLFSGFGLGTLLMPVFALFFPVPVAVAATAVVHLANNLFKLGLLAREAHWPVVLRFGLAAVAAALLGAAMLTWVAGMAPLAGYTLGGREFVITPVKAVIGVLIIAFALLELSPRVARLEFSPRWLPLGGMISGFFGGLSGNQGALRAAFLIRAGLSKTGFVATSAVCAVLVDTMRIAVYGFGLLVADLAALGELALPITVAAFSAFTGAWAGRRLLDKVTLRSVQLTVAAFMLGAGAALAVGLV